MNFIFCKLKNLKKHQFSSFASLKNLKKHQFHFLQVFSDFFFCDESEKYRYVYDDLMNDGNEIWKDHRWLKDIAGVDVAEKAIEWIRNHPGSDLGDQAEAIFESIDTINEALTKSEREEISSKLREVETRE